MPNDPVEKIGEHSAKIDYLVREMYLMREDMMEVKTFIGRLRGIGATLTLAGSVVGAVIATVVDHIWRK